MKFSNETKYSTIELRALFKEVNKQEGIEPRSLRVFTAKVPKWCAPTHFGTVVRGTAWCSLKHIQIGIPKHLLKGERKSMDSFDLLEIPLTQLDTEQTKTVARVYAHELAHIRGVHKHKDMVSWTGIDVDYLDGMTVGLKKAQPKKTHNIKQERYHKALGKVKAYNTKIKRNTNLLKKWAKKVRYYEKRGEQ